MYLAKLLHNDVGDLAFSGEFIRTIELVIGNMCFLP